MRSHEAVSYTHLDVYKRQGYYRPVQNWNDGKLQEYANRKEYDVAHSTLKKPIVTMVTLSDYDKPKASVTVEEPESIIYLFTTKTLSLIHISWTIAQVKSILKEETYIGHSVHNKQSNISFKNKKKVRKPQEEWYRVENTHEAIISEEVFQKVQELIASRRRKRRNGTTQIFAGLIKCADCGWSLAYGENKQNKNPYGYYHCSKNGQGLRQCSMHYIRYDVLYAYVLARLQYWSRCV